MVAILHWYKPSKPNFLQARQLLPVKKPHWFLTFWSVQWFKKSEVYVQFCAIETLHAKTNPEEKRMQIRILFHIRVNWAKCKFWKACC